MEIDLEIDGADSLQADFEELQERGESSAVFSVGSNAEYAPILEFGRGPIEAEEGSALKFEVDGETIFRKRVSGHPPYPWFKPAIREFQANPKTFVLDNTPYNSIEEISTADELVRAVSSALASQMEKNVSAQSSSDRSPGTHPDHPKTDTGNLRASINFVRVD